MKRIALVVGLLGALTAPAAAQCGGISNVTFTSYGSACGLGGTPTVLTGTWVPSACTLTFGWNIPGICCNIFVQRHLFVLGLQSTQIPLPGLGTGCTLWVVPALALELPPRTTTLSFVVPDAVVGATFYAQVANIWFDTFCMCNVYQLSQGLAVTFS
jgi:hypothetical protein